MSELHLVTGGCGFIGSHLVRRLLAKKKRVRVIDNLSTGRRANIVEHSPIDHRLEYIERDIRDYNDVRAAMEGVTHVYHLAALGSVQRSISHPRETEAVNVQGTLNLLECAKAEGGVQRFVFSSSSSVYGPRYSFPLYESDSTMPASPYALSKLAAESYCVIYQRLWKVPTVCLRYFNVFGPGQRWDGPYSAVIPRFISAMLRGESIEIHGSGAISRDFTYVDRVIEANIRAAEFDCVGHVLNVASGEEHSLMDVVTALSKIIPGDHQVTHTAVRPWDVSRSLASLDRMRHHLGHIPQIDFDLALAETVRWMRREMGVPCA